MILEAIYQNVRLKEDIGVIKHYVFLLLCCPKISTKELANRLFLPIPIVAAIKNELKKKNLVTDMNGIVVTPKGELVIRQELKIESVDMKRYLQIITMSNCHELFEDIEVIFENRPAVDVTIDQAKCTVATAFKRAQFMLQQREIITSKLLCVGDDDLVSVACSLLYKYITHGKGADFQITVVEKDQRVIDYIERISQDYQLDIICIPHDLRNPLKTTLQGQFDCVITDPPYTFNGLQLFVTRALLALKKNAESAIFLSYPHRPFAERLRMQEFFISNNIIINSVIGNFNRYEGAQILGGVSDFYHLKTTVVKDFEQDFYEELIYTRELKLQQHKKDCTA